jgi:hypothetical protein
MRFLKRLLISVYVYLGLLLVACFAAWLITGDEPTAIITGACGAAGVESIVGGIIKFRELQVEREKQNSDDCYSSEGE